MEISLYQPVKAFLEGAGYTVKGEVGGCDVVGVSEGDPTLVVVCELKLSFNLELILQAVDRASIADEVWIAARVSAKGRGRESDKRYRDLCRRLGFGMLGVAALQSMTLKNTGNSATRTQAALRVYSMLDIIRADIGELIGETAMAA